MTRKDYVRFAEHIKFMSPAHNKEEIVKFLIRVFKEDNGAFKEETFRKACEK